MNGPVVFIGLMVIVAVNHLGKGRAQGWVYDDTGCRTPDGGVGNCVVPKECNIIQTFLKTIQRPVPEEILEDLDRYACGVQDGNKVKICCPQNIDVLKMSRMSGDDSVRAQGGKHWVLPDDEDEDSCRTPEGGSGDCVSIRQCKPILTFLQGIRQPLSDYIRRRLQAYSCSTNGKVCCPPGPIVIDDPSVATPRPPTPTSGSTPDPPDVSRHPNLYLLPTDCGYLDIDNKIIFGENATLNEFPWMALLYYQGSRRGAQFKCGGSIINDRYILTAAHCIKNIKDRLVFVRVGEYDLGSKLDCQKTNTGVKKCADPVQDVTIEQILVHPQFNTSDFNNDIGLLRVAKMNLSIESARPVCLPTDPETRNTRYSNVVVTGWGNINNLGQTAKILQKVELPVINIQECQRTYKSQNLKVDYRQICAGARNGKDSCSGDSGGPLQVAAYLHDDTRYVQQGVVSYGPKECGLNGIPGVYTKVPYFMDWILDTIKP